MDKELKERLHLFLQVEKVVKEMNQKGVKECSETTLTCVKHIIKELRVFVFRVELQRIEILKTKGKISPKEAVHRKALLKKRYF